MSSVGSDAVVSLIQFHISSSAHSKEREVVAHYETSMKPQKLNALFSNASDIY